MLPDYNKAAEYLTARDTLNALAHLTERDQIYAAALSRFDSAWAVWCHEVDAYYISQDDTYDDSLARLVTGVVPLLREWLASDDITVAEHEDLEGRTREMLGESLDNVECRE